MVELELSTTEKAVAMTNALISGASVGAGVGVTTYSMITAGTAVAGAGVSVAAASAPFWIAGACAISGVIALGLGVWAYKEYTESAKKLILEIQKQYDKKLKLEKEYADALFEQTLLALKHHFMFSAMNFHGLHTEDNKLKSPPFMSEVIKNLEKHPSLHEAIVKQQTLSKEQNDELRLVMKENLDTHVKTSIHHVPKEPSYTRALVVGVGASIATFAAVMATSWGVSALVVGAGLATAGLAATPVIGWAILGGAVLLGLVIGGAMAYYKYKNIQRESVAANLKEENTLLKTAKNEVVTKTADLQKDLHTMAMTIEQVKHQEKVEQLQKENLALKTQMVKAAPVNIEKPQPVPSRLARSNSMPEIKFFNDHKNDPHFEAPRSAEKKEEVSDKKDRDDPETNNSKHK